jgi:hypothetical protein
MLINLVGDTKEIKFLTTFATTSSSLSVNTFRWGLPEYRE